MPIMFFGICCVMSILVLVADWVFSELLRDAAFEFFVLVDHDRDAARIEWLARKLLRLRDDYAACR